MRSLIAALRFLTRLPLPGPDTRAEDLGAAVGWFPVVGALVGFATAGVFVLATRLWSAGVAAVLAVGFGLLFTGGFHEDGFTDATDGLGGGYTKQRVLEIMKDSRIGAYGAMGLWCLLMLRWAALCELGPKSLWAMPLAMVWGRWSIAWTLYALPSISQGLAKEVQRNLGRMPFVMATGWLLVAHALGWHWGVRALWRPVALSAAVAVAWTLYFRRRLGGHTGDLLGAGNQLVEAAAILGLLIP
jgi:adenosylcobinamide-GDP ribazoletransferase